MTIQIKRPRILSQLKKRKLSGFGTALRKGRLTSQFIPKHHSWFVPKHGASIFDSHVQSTYVHLVNRLYADRSIKKMSWNNTTAQGNNTGGYALEALFTDHCFLCHVALFFVLLGSLILGLPISWNILWHLKVSVQSLTSHQRLPKCILLWETEN